MKNNRQTNVVDEDGEDIQVFEVGDRLPDIAYEAVYSLNGAE